MPQIVQDASILAAARNAIDILLRFKGQLVTLIPQGTPYRKPSGGEDFITDTEFPITLPVTLGTGNPRASQKVSLSKVGGDIVQEATTDEQEYRLRNYVLTGRHDMVIAVGDTWEDAEATYRVDTLDQSNGFKTSADVIGYTK